MFIIVYVISAEVFCDDTKGNLSRKQTCESIFYAARMNSWMVSACLASITGLLGQAISYIYGSRDTDTSQHTFWNNKMKYLMLQNSYH